MTSGWSSSLYLFIVHLSFFLILFFVFFHFSWPNRYARMPFVDGKCMNGNSSLNRRNSMEIDARANIKRFYAYIRHICNGQSCLFTSLGLAIIVSCQNEWIYKWKELVPTSTQQIHLYTLFYTQKCVKRKEIQMRLFSVFHSIRIALFFLFFYFKHYISVVVRLFSRSFVLSIIFICIVLHIEQCRYNYHHTELKFIKSVNGLCCGVYFSAVLSKRIE